MVDEIKMNKFTVLMHMDFLWLARTHMNLQSMSFIIPSARDFSINRIKQKNYGIVKYTAYVLINNTTILQECLARSALIIKHKWNMWIQKSINTWVLSQSPWHT